MSQIYALIDPRTTECRYVGKSDNVRERYLSHLKELSANTRKINWIKSLLALGLQPEVIVLEDVSNEVWVDAECFWIALFKGLGANLTNGTIGGDGSRGYKWTEEQKANLKKVKAISPNPMLGKSQSEETRTKIREARSKQVITPESIAKRAKTMIGYHHSEETKRKIGDAQRGEKSWCYGQSQSDDTNAKRSASLKKFYEVPENRAKRSETVRKFQSTKEYREKLSASVKASWDRRRGIIA